MRTILLLLGCLGCTSPELDSDTPVDTVETDLVTDDSEQECNEEGEACEISAEFPAPTGTCCGRLSCHLDGCFF